MKVIGYILVFSSAAILGTVTGFDVITLVPFALTVLGGLLIGGASMADTYEEAIKEALDQ
jgi:hypothetical protein